MNGERKFMITIIDDKTAKDISTTLNENNFYILQSNTPAQQQRFIIEFGKSPLPASIYSNACKKSFTDNYSDEYDIIKDGEVIGVIRVDFIKVLNDCNKCEYSIENIVLTDIEGTVNLQESGSSITLYIN